MNKLILNVYEKGATYRKGKLYYNNKLIMTTLEPTDRGLDRKMALGQINQIKVPGKTAIPYGTYILVMEWSPKFKMKTPHLLSVKGFSLIEMHIGNSSSDTEGCILVGMTDDRNRDWIGLSLTATQILYKLLNEGMIEGVTLTITDQFTQVLEKN